MTDVLVLLVFLAAVPVVVFGLMAVLSVLVIRRAVRVIRPRSRRPASWPVATVAATRMRSVGSELTEWRLFPLRSLLPGATRSVAAFRWELGRDADAAARAVAAGVAAGRPVGQLQSAARYVVEVASQIRLDLAVISSEPDRLVREALLREQDERIGALRRACAQIRRGVLLAAGSGARTLPHYVIEQLDDEIDRLRLSADAYQQLAEQPAARRLRA